MADKTILIIGAGIAGLAAGCYGQMNGYRTQIFEQHDIPGGLCTAWERKGYTFDGCIHYLLGSAPGQPFHRVWEELGALPGRDFINHDEFMRITDVATGRTLTVHTDIDRLERHMVELSPADAGAIRAFTRDARAFTRFDMSLMQAKPKSLMGLADWGRLGLTMLPFAPPLLRWALVSAADYARRFRDPFLRRAVAEMFAWPTIPMMAAMSLLASMQTRNAGFPVRGSLEFARAVEQRYLDLGGEIHYKAEVQKILVENDRAVGVRLYDDREFRGDAVISAADGHTTIFGMLGGQYVNNGLRRRYDGRLPLRPQLQVSLGVARDLAAEPHWATYLLDSPIAVAGEPRHVLGVKHYGFDKTLAPAGKSVIEVMYESDYGYWQRVQGEKLYDTEQVQVARVITEQLERLYPGIAQQIEVTDVATPVSYERYTGNWHGSNCGWLLTKQTMLSMLRGMGKTLPGLRNFYMAGQWVEPGGMVPIVAMSGRNVIQLVCHADGKPFVTTTVQG